MYKKITQCAASPDLKKFRAVGDTSIGSEFRTEMETVAISQQTYEHCL